MATYVDGFVITISKDKLAAYKKMAKEGCETWMKYGALDYKECIGDDMTPKDVKLTFPKMVQAKPTELIVFAYIVFKSKADRTRINKQVMAYFAEKYKGKEMPMVWRRFSYGGFKTIVEA
jgi:uncharacterized protein YbaA (DUF1428 family)